MDVYIGYDSREDAAYRVAVHSLAQHSPTATHHKLDSDDLYERRMMWRPVTPYVGRIKDHLSNAYQSTEFASTRFLTPLIHRSGWCLFVDCDVVFLEDVQAIFDMANDRYAVMVVKHNHVPSEGEKMDGQVQYAYNRKNWSSVVLWNCDHIGNQRLDLGMVNWWPGALLHRFCWLKDEEIGTLPAECNWLVNVEPMPARPIVAHFTLGGPWLDKWGIHEHDEIWLDAYRDCTA